jgi:uncharacterized iron-regulated membrane protein
VHAFRTLWLLHRWVGIAVGLLVMLTAASGLLLLVKKRFAWIQPPVAVGAAGTPEQLRPLADVYGAVFALGLPQLRSEADIARIDFRPDQRVHKVVSVHGDVEVQVCAVTLRTSGPAVRRSDWLERVHDGSWAGDWLHGIVMPFVALAVLFLAASGYVMWAWPKLRRRRAAPVPTAHSTGSR